MFSRTSLALVAVALFSADLVHRAAGHPGCDGDVNLADNLEPIFCPTDLDVIYDEGFCCDPVMEANIILQLDASTATGRCAEMQQEVLCAKCHPYSLHLYERLVTGLTMKSDYCNEFYAECSGQLDLDEGFCDFHASVSDDGTDQYWSYPLVVEPWTGDAVEVWPELDIDGNLAQPIDMRMTPDGTKWWIVDMEGQIMEIDVSDPESPPDSMKLVLDITDDMLLAKEEGLFSLAFSPAFHSTGVFFASYSPAKRDGSAQGFNRLSRFEYDASSAANTRASEEILVESSDKWYFYHAAGWIGFKPSAYTENPNAGTFHDLYWAMGDSGNQFDKSLKAQDPNELHGSIMRISVNSNMGVDYEIPDGNPFQNGGGLPEICALGFRNPFKCGFDRSNDELWCGDVGQNEVESIKKIECGNNYGWRQFEGHRCTAEIQDGGSETDSDVSGEPDLPYEFAATCDDPASRSPYTFPEFSYCHSDYDADSEPDYLFPDIPNDSFCGDGSVFGSAIIGGLVYRGQKYADLLGGNYLWGDYTSQRLHHLYVNEEGGGWGTEDGTKYGYGLVKSNLFQPSSFAEDNMGEVYMIQYKGSIYHLPCGELCGGDGTNVETPPPSPVPPFPTPAPLPVEEPDYAPIGCYGDGVPRIMGDAVAKSDELMTAGICSVFCMDFEYFGTQNGNECFCGDATTDLNLYCGDNDCADIVCATPCTGDSDETCGGPWAMSVYQNGDVAPSPVTPTPASPVPVGDYTELGCAVDAADARVMTVGPLGASGEDMSADICYGLCASELPAFEYFGTQYSFQCFCATTLPDGTSFEPEHDGCTSTCSGFPGETCGGSWSITVYQIGDIVPPTPVPTLAPGSGVTPTPTTEPTGDYVELGCAADPKQANGDRLMSEGPIKNTVAMSAEVCYGICADELPGFVYFGTQYSNECFCSTTLSTDVSFDPEHDGCTATCVGNPGETCGGTDAITVYQTGGYTPAPTPAPRNPTWSPFTPDPTPAPSGEYAELGCTADPNPGPDGVRVLSVGPIQEDEMSAEICYGICQDQLPGFEYFGTQWSIECFCGVTLADHASFDPEHDGCIDACAGNPEETCGGTDALTVYQVGDVDVGPTPAPVPDVAYEELGCASDPNPSADGGRVMSVGPIKADTMSAEICYDICADELPAYEYFGTQYSNECFCATTLTDDVTFDHDGCTNTCAGSLDDEICGGNDAITVYSVTGTA